MTAPVDPRGPGPTAPRPSAPRPGVPLLIGLLLVLLTGLGAVVPEPGPTPAQSRRVAPVTAEAVCLDLRQAAPVLRTRVSAGAPVVDARAGAGRARVSALAGGGSAVPLGLSAPGRVEVGIAQELDGDALVVRTDGALAAGLQVEQVARGTSGSSRGFAALRCGPARTDAWFVGGATTVGDAATLLLVNPDDTPAVVDVEVLTGSGRVDARPGRGIAIGARARTAVPLDRLAPDRDLLAVHVQAVRGRFAGAVRHVRFDGRVPRGVDWVPPAGPARTTVVVPGLPAGPGRRTVLIGNPGPEDTVVSVQLATADGLVVPAGLEAVAVQAGTTVAQDVSEQLAQTSAAVRVVSQGGPVLAGALVVDAQFTRNRTGSRPVGPVRELAWTGASEPLSGPALVTDVVLDRPTESTLLLAAFDQDAAVRVTLLPIVGREGAELPAPRTVSIPAGRTVALPLSSFLAPGATGRIAVEVRPLPGSGPVHAVRYLRERGETGPLSSLLVLESGVTSVRRPAVVSDPAVGTQR